MNTDELNRILYGKLEPGSSIGYHKYETSSEIIYIVSGKGKCLMDDEDSVSFAVVPEQ